MVDPKVTELIWGRISNYMLTGDNTLRYDPKSIENVSPCFNSRSQVVVHEWQFHPSEKTEQKVFDNMRTVRNHYINKFAHNIQVPAFDLSLYFKACIDMPYVLGRDIGDWINAEEELVPIPERIDGIFTLDKLIDSICFETALPHSVKVGLLMMINMQNNFMGVDAKKIKFSELEKTNELFFAGLERKNMMKRQEARVGKSSIKPNGEIKPWTPGDGKK